MKTLTFESGDGGKLIHTRERRRGAKVYNQEIWEEEEQREVEEQKKEQEEQKKKQEEQKKEQERE